MREIVITSTKDDVILEQLNVCLEGDLTDNWGERVLTFDNALGKGVVRSISFDWGVSLLDCDVMFNEDVKIVFQTSSVTPIEFVFISKGSFKYNADDTEEIIDLEQYQNIILAPKRYSKKTFMFPPDRQIKVNFIRILRKEYLKKKNNNVTFLNELLLSVFNDENANLPYKHKGSFSLKIADEVKALNAVYDSGIMRTLSLEGRLYLILAMQLMEHHNFENKVTLPESLSKSDIKKIHELSQYIVDNIANPLSVVILAEQSGLSPKKLQLGFRVLYSKSVNEYIRQLKLEISRDYLKNTELSVSEIVYAIGIKSRSYFSKIFSEAYGILPTEYRKHLLKKEL
ncbi:helix-turn-helix transcriptional regulator [Aggregatimonas sangjinii]|uniref:Helix-turn-helix transcriptional regulator n=1 Tax=Aggregatimonas sangjinii TaxID=2583587 RepID=A0A5B7SYT3_9FLAO|nr:AraC family transcriptional regulator [Aggregatimonas sangjinii]QCX01964.1 helix-turn-helix transcriptional regulator [Aggregatimonas sangjinii]